MARGGFERSHFRMIARFSVSLVIKTGANDGADFERQKENAREAFVNFDRMKIVYDRMLNVRFEKFLEIARGHPQRYLKTVKTPRDKVVRDESRDVRAFLGLVIKRDGD